MISGMSSSWLAKKEHGLGGTSVAKLGTKLSTFYDNIIYLQALAPVSGT
jgi:hypothetical protein